MDRARQRRERGRERAGNGRELGGKGLSEEADLITRCCGTVYSGKHGRTIVFADTKKEANELALNQIIRQDCQVLHGDIPQKQREITLAQFREGSFDRRP